MNYNTQQKLDDVTNKDPQLSLLTKVIMTSSSDTGSLYSRTGSRAMNMEHGVTQNTVTSFPCLSTGGDTFLYHPDLVVMVTEQRRTFTLQFYL